MALPNIWSRNHLIRDAICAAIHAAMKEDPRVYMLGEGASVKTHFDAPAIERDFADRVLTLPISEDGNIDFSVGLAISGLVPVYDTISSDFLYRCADSICNTAAKLETFRADKPTVVIRAEFFTGGPSTGQRVESLFCHVPGVNVVVPSNPADAYGLMATALRTPGVTLLFEDRMIEDATTRDNAYVRECVPFGKARICRTGSGVTIVSYGLTARLLHGRDDGWLAGTPYALIDLRTLYPLDVETVVASVEKTGALLVVEPDVQHGGVGAELVAQVAERYPGVWVARLGGPRVTIPTAREHHAETMPSAQQVLAKAREMAR